MPTKKKTNTKKKETAAPAPNLSQCEKCDALCCKYIGMPLDDPETWGDFDDFTWFMYHEGISIYVDEGDWYMNIESRCKMLGKDNKCMVYDKRPRICRRHAHHECEFDGKPYDFELHFHTADELYEYAKKFMRDKYKKNRKRKERAKKSAKKS